MADLEFIERRANVVQSADLVYDDEGHVITADSAVAESRGERIVVVGQRLPDVVQLIEDQLQYGKFPLTRPTVAGIVHEILNYPNATTPGTSSTTLTAGHESWRTPSA